MQSIRVTLFAHESYEMTRIKNDCDHVYVWRCDAPRAGAREYSFNGGVALTTSQGAPGAIGPGTVAGRLWTNRFL